MTQEQIQEIKARCEAARPIALVGVPISENNKIFLENAKQDVEALLAEVEKLQGDLNIARKLIDAKTSCRLFPQKDCAIYQENERLQAERDKAISIIKKLQRDKEDPEVRDDVTEWLKGFGE